jgi:hypothetical protein
MPCQHRVGNGRPPPHRPVPARRAAGSAR